MLRKLIITLLVTIGLAGLVTGVAWYLLHNESFLKKQIHSWFLNSTGRTMTFSGPLTLELGSDITLEAHKVSLSNASWGNYPNIAEVGRLQVTADLRSLFSGKPILRNVEIDDCQVDVAENDKGVSNWNLFASKKPQKPKPKPKPGLREPAFELDRGRANSCRVTITSPNREKPLLIKVAKLALDMQDDGKYLKHATGIVDDYDLTFDGKLGPLRALWQGGKFDHDIKLEVGDVLLTSSGTVADAKTWAGANISMNFTGPDISTVIHALALPPISTGEFDYDLDFDTQGAMTKVNINGDLGSLEATAVGELDRLLHPTKGNLKLTATGPNLGALAETLGVKNLVPDPFNMSLESSVKDGRIQLNPLVVSTQSDHLSVDGTIGPYPDYFQTDLDITLHSDDTDRWLTLFEAVPGPFGILDAKIRMTTDETGLTAVEAALDQADNHIEATGSLGHFPALNQPDFTLTFNTPNLQTVGNMFRVRHLPAVPASINGRIRKDNSGLHFDDLKAELAGDEFRVDGLLTPTEQYKGSRFQVEADIASTARFGKLLGISDIPDQPLHLKATVLPEGKGMNFRVEDSRLGDMNITVDGQIKDLDQPALVDSHFELKLPSLALLDFLFPETTLPDLPISASGELKSTRELVSLNAGHFSLGQTTADISGQYAPGKELVGTSIKLSASGSDWSELVSIAELESLPRDFRLSGTWARNQQGDQLNDLDVSLGEMNLKLNGHADDLLKFQNFVLQSQLTVADISVFNTLLKQTLKAQPLTASASLNGSKELFDINQLSVQLGDSDATGSLNVDQRTKLRLSGAIKSNNIDLKPFQKRLAEKQNSTSTESTGQSSTQEPDASSKKIFDDTPVHVVQDNPLDLDLKIQIERVEFNQAALEDISLGVLWEDDLIQVSPFTLRGVRGSEISGEFTFDGRNPTPEMDVILLGKDIRLGLTAVEGQDPETFPPVETHINLHGSGRTRHELAKSLEGKIRVYWGSGLYASQGMALLFSDFLTELRTVLNPSAKDSQYSELECAVAGADINSGIVTVKPILIHDKTVSIVSEGTINLETERLDLIFETRPRKGLGLSAGSLINSLIKVGGTLAAPAIELDAGGAVLKGGTAIATVGISVLAKSFSDRFLSSKDPCGDARKKLEEQSTTN